MSPEYRALLALRKPQTLRGGDMYLCARLGIVRVVNGHKNGQTRKRGLNTFHLYHWQKPYLVARPCDWRDGDPNSYSAFDPRNDDSESWKYIGNIFDMLPYRVLAGLA